MQTALAMRVTELRPAVADDDRSLAAQAQEGDTRAFESLYKRHVGRVHAVCLRLAANRAVAEECTQDAFIKAWESLKSFRGDASFGTWVHRIAVNTVLERHRTQLRQAAWITAGDEELMESVAGQDADPGHGVDLEECIAALPPAARMVFVLFDVEGHSHEEIAGMTGLAVGTSKAHLHRARQILRARLDA